MPSPISDTGAIKVREGHEVHALIESGSISGKADR